MKHRMMVVGLLAGLVTATSGWADASADEAAIHKRHDEWVAAWNKHDPQLMASFWVEDGDLITPTGRVAKGRAAVQKVFQDEQTGQGPWVGTTYVGKIDDIRLIGRDVAAVDVTAEVIGAKDAAGKVTPPMKHHVTWVAVKRHGTWMAFATRPCVPLSPGQ